MNTKKLLAEFIGTIFLLCTVVGSGIMADQLSLGNSAIALLANTLATVFILYVLIELFKDLSGAHFNPVVSFVMFLKKEIALNTFFNYVLVQLLGAIVGVWLAHSLFGLDIFQLSTKVRHGANQFLAEIIATTGLLFVILRSKPNHVSSLVACYIGAAYWFTSSTSFANPAATIGRMLTHTFAGIAPADVPLFILAQLIGGILGCLLNKSLSE